MRNTLKTEEKMIINLLDTTKRIKTVDQKKTNQKKRKKRLTIPAGNYYMCVLFVKRQRIRWTIVQDVSLAVRGCSGDDGNDSGVGSGGDYCGHRTSLSGSRKRICCIARDVCAMLDKLIDKNLIQQHEN